MEEEPERLAEVKGISEKKAREIAAQMEEKKDMRKAMIFLQQYGISTTLGVKIYNQYGNNIYQVIKENPYQMADDINGVGFRIADEIASKAVSYTHLDVYKRQTLTKRMAEDLTDYMREIGIRVKYLHSDIDTLERTEIIRDMRLNVFDVLVGINLLREGLDIPEISLVAILDADKEGFLRSETSLVLSLIHI